MLAERLVEQGGDLGPGRIGAVQPFDAGTEGGIQGNGFHAASLACKQAGNQCHDPDAQLLARGERFHAGSDFTKA